MVEKVNLEKNMLNAVARFYDNYNANFEMPILTLNNKKIVVRITEEDWSL